MEWNDSLSGHYLWTNVNFGEAVTEVMTPLSWTVLRLIFGEWKLLSGFSALGNIGGRPYLNMSLFASLLHATGRSRQDILERLEGTLYMKLPQQVDIPMIPLSRWRLLANLPTLMRTQYLQWKAIRELPAYLAENPNWCRRTRHQIEAAATGRGLAQLWEGEIRPHVTSSVWMVMGSVFSFTTLGMSLRRELGYLVGQEDSDALLANLSDGQGMLASLGPLAGLARLASGQIDRETYLVEYGHRGPHEFELSVPRPAEQPDWIDHNLIRFRESPVDIDALLAKQHMAFEAAWVRLKAGYPGRAKVLRPRIARAARLAHLREAARSEYVRDRWLVRDFALRAAALTGVGHDIFFLTLEEVLGALRGNRNAILAIPDRKDAYLRYKALPAYPSIIRGSFDPLQWASNPDRRSDYYDAEAGPRSSTAKTGQKKVITGSPGSAGRVESRVRRLDRAEDGDQLRDGEVLVTSQTDIAWTLLFPRATAIVTDIGAPLSHAAIVARELGIPAVLGCGNATTRLATGDRVLVDGARGIVEVLEP